MSELRTAAERVRAWLADKKLEQWDYMEVAYFYEDRREMLVLLDAALKAEQPHRTLCPDAYPCPFACGRDAECYRHSLPRTAPAEQPQPVEVMYVQDGLLRWSKIPQGYTGYLYAAPPPPAAAPCPHIRSSGTGEWATNWCALNGPPPPAAAPVTDAMVEAGWQASAASKFTQAEARRVIEAALAAREGR